MLATVTLRIFFVGMIAFAQDNATISVYLPSSGDHETHYPFLLYDPGQWSVTGVGCGASEASDLSNDLQVALNGDACRDLGDISISNLEPSLLTAQYEGCGKLPQNSSECTYFCWVPNMDLVSDGTASTLQSSPPITGSLSIGQGKLETFEFAVLYGSIHSMLGVRGLVPGTHWEKAVSEIVVWTVGADSPSVTLGSGTVLTLNGSAAGDVDLVIGNMPSKPQNGSIVARHFQRYYEIAQNRGAHRFIPTWWPWPFTDSSDEVCKPSEPPNLLKPFKDGKRLGSIEVSSTAVSDLNRDDHLTIRYVFERSICPQAYFSSVAQD